MVHTATQHPQHAENLSPDVPLATHTALHIALGELHPQCLWPRASVPATGSLSLLPVLRNSKCPPYLPLSARPGCLLFRPPQEWERTLTLRQPSSAQQPERLPSLISWAAQR